MTTTDVALAEKPVTFTPTGASEGITLTINIVRRFFTKPTKQGHEASDEEVMKFMMLCKARTLDPWTGDAWLLGYDSRNGPEFSLITSHQSMLKRSEMSDKFDGLESGIIVKNEGGEPIYRGGAVVFDKDKILGAWSKCHRRDRKIVFAHEVNFSAYSKDNQQWKKDPAGMIVKCAEMGALRKAFPTQLGGLYSHEERGIAESDSPGLPSAEDTAAAMSDIAGKLNAQRSAPDEATGEAAEGEVEAEVVEDKPDELDVLTEELKEEPSKPKTESDEFEDSMAKQQDLV